VAISNKLTFLLAHVALATLAERFAYGVDRIDTTTHDHSAGDG
jgi:hypothetical protein